MEMTQDNFWLSSAGLPWNDPAQRQLWGLGRQRYLGHPQATGKVNHRRNFRTRLFLPDVPLALFVGTPWKWLNSVEARVLSVIVQYANFKEQEQSSKVKIQILPEPVHFPLKITL